MRWLIRCQEFRVPVAPLSLANDMAMRFLAGRALHVELQREAFPDEGMAVYGHWTDQAGLCQSHKLGFIPQQDMQNLYKQAQNRHDCIVSAKVSDISIPPRDAPFPGLTLDIAVLEPDPQLLNPATSWQGV